MASPLEMYSKFVLANWTSISQNGKVGWKNDQWPTVISSSRGHSSITHQILLILLIPEHLCKTIKRIPLNVTHTRAHAHTHTHYYIVHKKFIKNIV